MNIFQLTYDARLKSWYNLRHRIENTDTQTKCVEVDAWWQKAPMVNHYLHQQDTKNWPGPWDLLVDNTYCTLARGLGMYYTLALVGVQAIDFVLGKDDNDAEVSLVTVDNAKYILNYYPNTVLSNTLAEFKITTHLKLDEVVKKLK
jgi:hypothetical protein